MRRGGECLVSGVLASCDAACVECIAGATSLVLTPRFSGNSIIHGTDGLSVALAG